jgi:hypothetical protein
MRLLQSNRSDHDVSTADSSTCRTPPKELDVVLGDFSERLAAHAEASKMASHAPLPPAASEAVVGQQIARDPQWSALERTAMQPGAWLASMTPGMTPEPLFRNRWLNPADTYIPMDVRHQLTAMFEATEPQVILLEQLHRENTLAEALELRDRVSARTLTPRREIAMLHGESVAMDQYPVSGYGVYLPKPGGGGMDAIDQQDLPRTSAILEGKAFAAVERGEAVLAWFAAHGLCPTEDVEQIRAALHANASRYLARMR